MFIFKNTYKNSQVLYSSSVLITEPINEQIIKSLYKFLNKNIKDENTKKKQTKVRFILENEKDDIVQSQIKIQENNFFQQYYKLNIYQI